MQGVEKQKDVVAHAHWWQAAHTALESIVEREVVRRMDQRKEELSTIRSQKDAAYEICCLDNQDLRGKIATLLDFIEDKIDKDSGKQLAELYAPLPAIIAQTGSAVRAMIESSLCIYFLGFPNMDSSQAKLITAMLRNRGWKQNAVAGWIDPLRGGSHPLTSAVRTQAGRDLAPYYREFFPNKGRD